MRLALFIIVVLVVVLGIYYIRNDELPFSMSLPKSEVCDTIREREKSQDENKKETPEDPSTLYNSYADGIRFVLKGCFLR